MDPEKHAEFTGVRNDIIIDNFRKAAQLYNEKIIIRVPFIEGINDDDDNIQRLQRLMRESNVKTIVFLPYHRLGEHKYKQLGKTYNFDAKPPTKKRMEEVCQSFEEQGLTARIHG
jgi:pyruvate formate lyase activating enzyme